MACIEKYGPYVVFEHNIAMPHTQENAEGAHRTGIGFMVSKKLIDFGEDEDGEKKEANVFFTLSAVNPEEHLANIAQLTEIFMNDDLIDALAAAETPEDILKAAGTAGNASLTGATLYALDTGFGNRLKSFCDRAEVLELSCIPEFPARYISYMGV